MLHRELRPLFITNSLSGGGAERSTNIVVNALLENGIKVGLVTVNDGHGDLVVPKCAVFELKRPIRGKFFSVVRAFIDLQRAIRIWKPNFVVLNCDLPELLGSFSFGKFQLIVVEHSSAPWTHRVHLGRIVRKILKLRGTLWVGVSSHLSIWNVQLKPDYVVQNPILDLVEVKKNYSGQISRLVFIGRLSVEKQASWIISLGKLTSLPVLLIGDGLLRKDLETQSKDSLVSTEFLGFVEDPWKYIKNGDLLIVPSAFEGDGLVPVEAFKRNVPILLNDINDFRRFSLPEFNYCHEIQGFADRISQFKFNSEKFVVPESCVEKNMTNRSPSDAASRWIEMLSTLV
jgi:hypothetical protein